MDLLLEIENDPNSIVVYNTFPEIFPVHSHTKGQLTYFEGGSAHLYTKANTYFVPTNHVVWVPKLVSHHFDHLKTQNITVRSVYFPEELIAEPFFDEIGIFKIHPLMREIFAFSDTQTYAVNTMHYQLLSASIQLLPKMVVDPLLINLPHTKNQVIKKAIKYIHDHLAEDIKVSVLAQKSHLGLRTFTRLFFAEIGITVNEYLKSARIMRSIELILDGKLNLTQIGYNVGYTSLASFSNAFYKLTKKRPSEFRIEK